MVQSPLPQDTKIAAPSMSITPSVIEEGKKVLTSKGFGPDEVKNIVSRMTGSMAGKGINNLNGYFLSACNKEVKKSSNSAGSVHKSTGATLQVKKEVNANSALTKKEEVKQAAAELLNKIRSLAPDKIDEIIMDVNNNPNVKKALTFFESDIIKKEILASHYVCAFEKRYPEIVF
jgi:hypothetical protein